MVVAGFGVVLESGAGLDSVVVPEEGAKLDPADGVEPESEFCCGELPSSDLSDDCDEPDDGRLPVPDAELPEAG